MPTPYDLYVRFLVTKGVDDVNDANKHLAELNLPPVADAAFDAQYSLVTTALHEGVIAQIEKKTYSVDFLRWMTVLQVEELWQYEVTSFTKDRDRKALCKLVYDIHQDFPLRTAINALLIKAVPLNDIVQAINQRFATLLRDEHLRIYEKFFFNPRQMTRGSWRSFIKSCDSSESSIYFIALSEPIEVVKTELEMPSKTSSSENLQFLATKSFLRARQLLRLETPEGGEEARKWIDTYLKVTDKYEKHRSGDMGDFGNALQMEFQFVDTAFNSPDPEVLKELSARMKERDDKKAADDAEKGSPLPEPAA